MTRSYYTRPATLLMVAHLLFNACSQSPKQSADMMMDAPASEISIAKEAQMEVSASEVSMEEEAQEMPAAATPTDYKSATMYVSSSAATFGKADSTRQFIRTANLRFKAKDLIKGSYAIEDIVARQGGFITQTLLRSEVDYTNTVRVSRDSSLVSTYYTLSNTMEIRVPARQMDTTLKEIAVWIDYLEFRKINCQDISLSLLSNELARKRAAKQGARIGNAIDTRGNKLDQVIDAEQELANKQELADNSLLSNLQLKDQVEYATINLSIYQSQAVKHEMQSNETNIAAYQPNFGTRLLDAFHAGAGAFVFVVLFFAHLWVLFVLGGGGWFAYLYYKKRRKSL